MGTECFEPSEREIQDRMQEERKGIFFKDKTDVELKVIITDLLRQNKKWDFERQQRALQKKNTIHDLVEKFVGSILNSGGVGLWLDETTDLFLGELIGEHRTLQQNFWRFVRQLAKKYAALDDRFFDPRNEDAKKYAKKIAELDGHLSFI